MKPLKGVPACLIHDQQRRTNHTKNKKCHTGEEYFIIMHRYNGSSKARVALPSIWRRQVMHKHQWQEKITSALADEIGQCPQMIYSATQQYPVLIRKDKS